MIINQLQTLISAKSVYKPNSMLNGESEVPLSRPLSFVTDAAAFCESYVLRQACQLMYYHDSPSPQPVDYWRPDILYQESLGHKADNRSSLLLQDRKSLQEL